MTSFEKSPTVKKNNYHNYSNSPWITKEIKPEFFHKPGLEENE